MSKKNFAIITEKASVRDAIKKLNIEGVNSLCVVDKNNKMLGVFTDGDFQRSVILQPDLNI